MEIRKEDSGIDELIFISDVHFGAKPSSTCWLGDTVEYFDKFFIPLIRAEKSDGHSPAVVVAGDYFDNRQHIDISVLNAAMGVMDRISRECHVYMVIGNHDIYKKSDTDITSLRVFDRFDNVTVIYDRMVLSIAGGKKFALVSWKGDRSTEGKIISEYKESVDYIVLHTEISGMSYDNNRPIINGVNVSMMGDDCRILSGHIHKRQEGKKAMYFGSPYHIDRADIGNEKGVYIFSTVSGGIERRFIPNDFSPKYIKVNFSEYGRNASAWGSVIRNNYVYIVVDEEDKQKFNINKFSEELQAYSPKRIEFLPGAKAASVNEEVKVNADSTIDEIFTESIKAKNLPEKKASAIREMNQKYIKIATEEMSK